MKKIELPQDYALVLQQIDEFGEEAFDTLAESLRIDRKRLTHIIESLRHKGLILIHKTRQDAWLRLSTKGQRLMQYMWPEAHSLQAI
jgi:DNA-binding MarR family transcriptional regulator